MFFNNIIITFAAAKYDLYYPKKFIFFLITYFFGKEESKGEIKREPSSTISDIPLVWTLVAAALRHDGARQQS